METRLALGEGCNWRDSALRTLEFALVHHHSACQTRGGERQAEGHSRTGAWTRPSTDAGTWSL